MRKLMFAAAVALFVAACQTQPTQAPAPTDESKPTSGAATPGTGAATAGAGQAGVGGTATGSAGRDPLHDPSSPLSKRSVYFEFDSFAVKDEYRPLVEAHARYLQGNRSARLTIQGNADERGSREYNIALGQKRAEAVKRMMQVLGVSDSQVETVSFGKEKPKALGHDEAAWAQNRRDDIVYAGE